MLNETLCSNQIQSMVSLLNGHIRLPQQYFIRQSLIIIMSLHLFIGYLLPRLTRHLYHLTIQ